MKSLVWLCASALSLAAVVSAVAQDQSSGTMSPPKILTITREFVKPGKSRRHARQDRNRVCAGDGPRESRRHIIWA